ncbi:acyltransferase [Pseudomonas protegens]|uniref:Acyltransferase n=1 Tax=Pseudomonas protegens TaxID=380021 RepID=A0ABY2VH06_9PSED|nr:acyltransferase [Pseudomonas protegens]ASE24351.1 acyltransferase [Pseudomonas protegens]QEZ52006.1 acyltransferase [Pseudomonas protegens]QEZ55924.1 acyltransferase [Pseudomonas protegens]QEZ63266.1 acyltransferase [Pseudomonas protegens]QIC26847.1 acyltransferase [Pseudomonas protegens]
MSASRIVALDGLRGVAALIVFVSHYSNETGLFGGILGWGGGQTGVMLFFLLSGFLVSNLHISQKLELSSLWVYAVRRISRVYPLFLMAAALPGLLIFLEFPGQVAMSGINSFDKYLGQVLLLDRGENVFWTIQIEVLFYIAFVGLWFVFGIINKASFVCLVVGLALLIWSLGPLTSLTFLHTAHYFLFGVLSALMYCGGAFKYLPRIISVVGLVLLLAIPLTFPKVFKLLFGGDIVSWESSLIIVQLLIVFNIAIRDRYCLEWLLSLRPLVWLGKVSYSVYLIHYFVISGVVSLTTPSDNYFLNFTMVFALVLVFSWASNSILERPMQRALARALLNRVEHPSSIVRN